MNSFFFLCFDLSIFLLCFLTFRLFNCFSSLKTVWLLYFRLRMFSWKGIRQEFKRSKREKYTFGFFDFSSSVSAVWLLYLRFKAAHVHLKRHPAKKNFGWANLKDKKMQEKKVFYLCDLDGSCGWDLKLDGTPWFSMGSDMIKGEGLLSVLLFFGWGLVWWVLGVYFS